MGDNSGDNSDDGYAKRFAKWTVSKFTSNAVESDSKILGKSKGSYETEDSGIFGVHPANFVLGASWGLISGYTSQVFFAPVPDKWKALRFFGYVPKFKILKKIGKLKYIYSAMVTSRILRRSFLAGVTFDVAETQAAQKLNSGKSSTATTLAGLSVLAVFFRVTNGIRDTVIASTFILGGYAVGSKIARFVHQMKNGKND